MLIIVVFPHPLEPIKNKFKLSNFKNVFIVLCNSGLKQSKLLGLYFFIK